MTDNKRPTILVTGASGIIGKNFLEAAKGYYDIFAVARRPQHETTVPEHPDIKWLQVDIANYPALKSVTLNAVKGKDVDFVLHLASYYDFNYSEHSEYERTNVLGTSNVLELAKVLIVKRFVFTGSVAACSFPPKGGVIDEKSPADAGHPYAVSKRKGEELVKGFSTFFPCTIVRPAAVFTDWGEYGFLYMFLSRWFSRKWWKSILGGKGECAVPYIHIQDLTALLLTVFRESQRLPRFDTYIAGPDGATSLRELFEAAAYYAGEKRKPFFLPRFVIQPLVATRDFVGRFTGTRPFERTWMCKYFDSKLIIDSSYTRKTLAWEPSPRFHILRRLLYLIEKMKTYPEEWHYRNARAMKRISMRPNLLIFEVMVQLKNEMIDEIKRTLLDKSREKEFLNYQKLNMDNFEWDVAVFYQLLTASVRNKDRMLLTNYAGDLLSPTRFSEGFSSREVCAAVLETGKIVIARLLKEPVLQGMEHMIHDCILLTIQLTVDEIESVFARLGRDITLAKVPERSDIEEKLKDLAAFF